MSSLGCIIYRGILMPDAVAIKVVGMKSSDNQDIKVENYLSLYKIIYY